MPSWLNFMMVIKMWRRKTILLSVLCDQVIFILKTFADCSSWVYNVCLQCDQLFFLLELSFAPHLIQYAISKPWQSLGSNIHCILNEGQRGHSCFHNNKLYFEQTWYFKSKDIHYLPDGANFSLQYFRGWVAFSSIT